MREVEGRNVLLPSLHLSVAYDLAAPEMVAGFIHHWYGRLKMDHAITIGDLVRWALIAGGTIGVLWLIGWLVLVVFNPFSSGH